MAEATPLPDDLAELFSNLSYGSSWEETDLEEVVFYLRGAKSVKLPKVLKPKSQSIPSSLEASGVLKHRQTNTLCMSFSITDQDLNPYVRTNLHW